ncbi:MAG TPA: DUF1499 domain-containing protein [bacterium]
MHSDRSQRTGGWRAWLPPAVVLALLLAASSAVLEVLGGLGARLGWWHFSFGFQLLRWGARVGAAAVVLALLTLPALLAAGWLRRWPLPAGAALSLVLGATTLGLPWLHLQTARSVPPIHDITTDWDDPPAFQALLPLRAGAPNAPDYDGPDTANQQRRFYGDIGPARFREEPPAVFAAVERVAQRLGWRVVAAEPGAGRLEATDTTFWFGFTDDVVVRVRAAADGAADGAAGGGTRVDVRSKSRVGRSDIGTNARRVRRFLHALQGAGLTPRS